MNCLNIRIILLMLTLVVLGSISHITLPLVVEAFPSTYFILFVVPIEGIIIYLIIMGIRKCQKKINQINELIRVLFTYWRIIIPAGIVNVLMNIFMLYSANPIRTPIVIQSVFLGLAVIPSIIFSKILLNKIVRFNYKFAISSIVLLMVSVGISIIPLITKSESGIFGVGWIIMYIIGIGFYSLTNVLQEKYIRDSKDDGLDNKFYLAFESNIIQFILIVCFCWIDIYLGYTTSFPEAYEQVKSSFYKMGTDPIKFLILQMFVILWHFMFMVALFLNEISTNYTMILTNITNQSIALFFIIFPHLNNGIHYPLYITLPSLGINFLSVLFWVKAEKPEENEETVNLV